jgi:hypothetical protein
MNSSVGKAINAPTTGHQQGACVHHWRIESSSRRESQGVCKRCGATRSFSNTVEGAAWERDQAALTSAHRPRVPSSRRGDVTLADEA